MVVGELDNIVLMGGTISCPYYPHSAEDVALALNTQLTWICPFESWCG
jgi:hypothetical protein